MKKFHHVFSEINSGISFIQLARTLECTAINDHINIIPTSGSGNIRRIKFEEGLSMRAWDITLIHDIEFHKIPETSPVEKMFHVVYFFNPEVVLKDNPRLGKKWKAAGSVNMFFFSNDADMHFEIKTGDKLKAVDISVTETWLKAAFNSAGPLYTSFISQLNNKPSPTVFFEAATANEYQVMADLHESALATAGNTLHLKASVLSLLSDFFDRVVNRPAIDVLRTNIFYYDKMLEAKKIIVSHLLGSLPSIDAISKQVALSPSTLKRHFKLMFQKSIYEYYLDQKMEFANRMLHEKPLSVNEVASMLGYEKSSNFIDMFKKHFGHSPGSLRKKAAG